MSLIRMAYVFEYFLIDKIVTRLQFRPKKNFAGRFSTGRSGYGQQEIYCDFFLIAIWLLHGQLWAFIEETASLTLC